MYKMKSILTVGLLFSCVFGAEPAFKFFKGEEELPPLTRAERFVFTSPTIPVPVTWEQLIEMEIVHENQHVAQINLYDIETVEEFWEPVTVPFPVIEPTPTNTTSVTPNSRQDTDNTIPWLDALR